MNEDLQKITKISESDPTLPLKRRERYRTMEMVMNS
jgi:hypothetical protein